MRFKTGSGRKVLSYELQSLRGNVAFVAITDAPVMPRHWVRVKNLDVFHFAGFHDKTIECFWGDTEYILVATE